MLAADIPSVNFTTGLSYNGKGRLPTRLPCPAVYEGFNRHCLGTHSFFSTPVELSEMCPVDPVKLEKSRQKLMKLCYTGFREIMINLMPFVPSNV